MSLVPDDEFGDFVGHLALLESPRTPKKGTRQGWGRIMAVETATGQVSLLSG
jgi:hypothetical protein